MTRIGTIGMGRAGGEAMRWSFPSGSATMFRGAVSKWNQSGSTESCVKSKKEPAASNRKPDTLAMSRRALTRLPMTTSFGTSAGV